MGLRVQAASSHPYSIRWEVLRAGLACPRCAKVAQSLPEGQWSDPVETPFGVHLVLVQERTRPQSPPLAEIRTRVEAAYESSQRQERLTAAMEELRTRYEVVVE